VRACMSKHCALHEVEGGCLPPRVCMWDGATKQSSALYFLLQRQSSNSLLQQG